MWYSPRRVIVVSGKYHSYLVGENVIVVIVRWRLWSIRVCHTLHRRHSLGKHVAPNDVKNTEKTQWETTEALGIRFEIIPDIGVDNGKQRRLAYIQLLTDRRNGYAFWLDAIVQFHQEWDDKREMFLPKLYHD